MTADVEPQEPQKNRRVSRSGLELPSISEGLPSSSGVRKYEYTVPLHCRRAEKDPHILLIRELSADQEEDARRSAARAKAGNAIELAKASLYAVDEHVVNHGEFEADAYWSRFSSKVRQLVIYAYDDVHNVAPEVADGFLASRTER